MIARSAFAVERKASTLFILIALILMASCSGHLETGGPAAQFPEESVAKEDVEKLLKFDARVQDFSIDGNKLIVNVNQSWMSSPPGIQERAMGRWYGYWQAAHGGSAAKLQKGVDVVARFEGKEVAHWSSDGYKVPEKESMSQQAKSE
ncbi:MAG: hypothetical protein AB1631_08820 [Acidobacteriota bacterium]